jgi:WD40 repeat protein/tRNA A-37 threonylcarbamoyl transferase component Bud32
MIPDDPDVSEEDSQLGEVLAEWLEAAEGGRALDRTAFLARHPRHAAELQRCLGAWEKVNQWAAPLRQVSQAARLSTDHAPTRIDGPAAPGGKTGLSAPAAFDDYEVLEELGRGGMAVVYKARQRSLDRLVALKMFRALELGSTAEVERFRKEAALVARLEHPCLVPLHEVGEQGGRPYFTMRLMEGGSLAEKVTPFQTDPAAAARILAAVARAVHHVHQRGVLHRDLKPSNILLDAAGQPHVTDFGLAKVLEADTGLTQSGALVGTPSYMAPEQAGGGGEVVTTATDVYGLGATLYALLTGRPPFQGADVLQTLAQVKDREPTPPGTLNPRVERDLQTICLKCLEKQPGRRYPSAEALAEDLERWLAGEPIRARPNSAWERAWKWARRRPAVAALVAVSTAALLGLLAGLYLYNLHLGDALAASDRLRSEGLEREARLRRLVYVADLRAGRQAWEDGDQQRARDLLVRQVPRPGEEDLRDFAWHYLRACCRFEPRLLGRHDAPVLGLGVSPDGRWLATGDRQGVVTVWDLAAGREHKTLQRSGQEVGCLRFAPDGRTLATAGQGLVVRLWDVATWKPRGGLVGTFSTVRSVAFAPDGSRLAAGLADGSITVWKLSRGGWPSRWKEHRGDVGGLAWSPDGRRLISCGKDGTVRLWDPATGKALATLSGPQQETMGPLALSSDGSLVATSGFDGWVRLWDVASRTQRAAFSHAGPVRGMAFAPRSQSLVVVGAGGVLTLLEASGSRNELRLRAFLRAGAADVSAVAFLRQGHQLVTASADGTVKLWEVAALTGVRQTPQRGLLDVLSADGRLTASADADGTLHLRDVAGGASLGTLAGERGPIRRALLSPRGRLLATAGPDGGVWIWDVVRRRLQVLLVKQRGRIDGLAFSPTEDLLATGGADGSVLVWDARTGKLRATLRDGRGQPLNNMHSLLFTADGTTLFSCANLTDAQIHVWDVRTGKRRRGIPVPERNVSCLALSPDGKRLAAGLYDRLIRVWDVATGRELATLTGHTRPVWGLAFSPDGRILVSTSGDRTVRLWHLPTLQELFPLTHLHGMPGAVAFSRDGRTLTVCSTSPDAGGEVLRWSCGRR